MSSPPPSWSEAVTAVLADQLNPDTVTTVCSILGNRRRQLVVLYLSNVFISSVEKISDRLSLDEEETKCVCAELSEQNIVTETESSETYALSRAVIR